MSQTWVCKEWKVSLHLAVWVLATEVIIDFMCKGMMKMYDNVDWNMAGAVEEIRELAAQSAALAIKENKKAVLLAWEAVYLIEKTANLEGLFAIEDKLEYFGQLKVPFYDVLELAIRMLMDGMGYQVILEVMTNDFYTRKQDAVTVLILYFYMACALEIEEGLCAALAEENDVEAERQDVIPLQTAKPVSNLMEKNLELIPKEYQKEFMEVLYCC